MDTLLAFSGTRHGPEKTGSADFDGNGRVNAAPNGETTATKQRKPAGPNRYGESERRRVKHNSNSRADAGSGRIAGPRRVLVGPHKEPRFERNVESTKFNQDTAECVKTYGCELTSVRDTVKKTRPTFIRHKSAKS